MSKSQSIEVKNLHIDLNNFRTVTQKDETSALRAMIAIAPSNFWGLMDSLLDDGYLPNENVIALKEKDTGNLIVKEGNRRIGCLKLIHGLINDPSIEPPPHVVEAIAKKDSQWLADNSAVPCVVYATKDEPTVDRIVSLTHGKGQKAGRDPWETIARARHSRDKEGKSEPGLDLFEKYLLHAKNFTPDQADRWSGAYELSILDEAARKTAARFGSKTAKELADNYPKVSNLKILNALILDIGQKTFGFKEVRSTSPDFFVEKYGLADPAAASSGGSTGGTGTGGGGTTGGTGTSSTGGTGTGGGGTTGGTGTSGGGGTGTGGGGTTGGTGTGGGGRGAGKTPPLDDPKSVKKVLSKYAPRGGDQHKLATLTNELKELNVEKTPHAFCFILRSMFEIAAKQFATVKSISLTKAAGGDKSLFELLKDVSNDLTTGKPRTDPLVKKLHGALQELGKTHGFLSVTSLNQLVHNPKFSANSKDICGVFHNVFPLLEEITK